MTIQEFLQGLSGYNAIEESIAEHKEALERLRAKISYPHAVQLDKDKVQRSQTGDGMCKAVQEIITLEQRIQAAESVKGDIDKILGGLNPIEREIIELKFKRGLTYYAIGKEIGYCRRQVFYIKNQAFKKIAPYIAL